MNIIVKYTEHKYLNGGGAYFGHIGMRPRDVRRTKEMKMSD